MFNKIFELLKVAFKTPDFTTIRKVFNYISTSSVKIVYTTISFLTLYVFLTSIFSNQFTMNPFTLPSGFSSDGYAGEVLSREVMDRFNQISEEIIDLKKDDDQEADDKKDDGKSDKSNDKNKSEGKNANNKDKNALITDASSIDFSNGLENLDVEVMGLGLSIGKLSEYIKTLLGIEVKKISGELVRKDSVLILNMRLTGYPPLNIISQKTGTDYQKIDFLKEQAALELKKYFSPLEVAFYLYKKGKYEEAIEAADFAHTVLDEDYASKHWGYYIKALSLIELDKSYEDINEQFQLATEEASDFVEGWFKWAFYLNRQGRYKEAIKKFKKTIDLDSKHARALLYWGQSLIELYDYDNGIKKYKEALEINPKNDYINYSIGFDLQVQGKFYESIDYLKKAIDYDPTDVNYYMELAESYWYNGDTTLALDTYVRGKNAVKSYSKQKELYKTWSTISLLAGKQQEAISIMSQYLKWEDQLIDNQNTLVDIYLEMPWQEFYEEKVTFYKESIIKNRKAYHYKNLAFLHFRTGKYDSSIYYYNEYFRIYVGRPEYYIDLADNYMASNNFELAIDYYEKYSQSPDALESIAMFRSSLVSWGLALLRNNQPKVAMEKFIQARNVTIYTTADVYHGLALASEALGENILALSYYYQGMDKEENPLLLAEYADLLTKMGKEQESEEIITLLFSSEEFENRSTARDIYNERGMVVALKYYNILIENAERKGKYYTLLAYVYALDGQDELYFEQMKKAKDSGFPIKGLMRYFPYNKKKYAERMAAMIN